MAAITGSTPSLSPTHVGPPARAMLVSSPDRNTRGSNVPARYLAGTFEPRVFLSGLLTNMALAGGPTWVGDKLGVDPVIAAIVAFGVRLLDNPGALRRPYPPPAGALGPL